MCLVVFSDSCPSNDPVADSTTNVEETQPQKEEPNFELSGKLTEFTNTFKVCFSLLFFKLEMTLGLEDILYLSVLLHQNSEELGIENFAKA